MISNAVKFSIFVTKAVLASEWVSVPEQSMDAQEGLRDLASQAVAPGIILPTDILDWHVLGGDAFAFLTEVVVMLRSALGRLVLLQQHFLETAVLVSPSPSFLVVG